MCMREVAETVVAETVVAETVIGREAEWEDQYDGETEVMSYMR